MYLPKSFLSSVLHNNGYTFKHLFVSYEYRKTKHYGDLYPEVLNELDIYPEDILHIGDNYNSDIKNAEII